MALEVEATYENGVLKLDEPLPFKDGERLMLRITPKRSASERFCGSLKWTGDPEVLRRIAEDDEFGIYESP